MIRRTKRETRDEKSETNEGFHGMGIIRFVRLGQFFQQVKRMKNHPIGIT